MTEQNLAPLLSSLESQIQDPNTSLHTLKFNISPTLNHLKDDLQRRMKRMMRRRKSSQAQHEDQEIYRVEKYLRDVDALIGMLKTKMDTSDADLTEFLRRDENGNSDSFKSRREGDGGVMSRRDADNTTTTTTTTTDNNQLLQQNDESQQNLLLLEQEAKHHTDESLDAEEIHYLRENVRELLDISTTMQDSLQEQEKQLETISDNIEKATVQVEKGVLDQKTVVRGATLGLVVGGVALGGALGGPVGAYFGYQAAALGIGAAVGLGAGSVTGAMSGYGVGRFRTWVSGTNKKTRTEKKKDELDHALDNDESRS
uniref:t-SNARE coiled-coil homology domain-containing protein n=1 Tax=Percolomonas cosmopolitus TaxID=63605 RepID=A0A7S1PHM3_9EUKA|eukprot:CAMPEP_0117441884 /NCGR_PEP_ID=MMETSP0759-20121206/3864_1 /TAXON_ID=63605 /ORGANISM="Percolomonas cosmopolitus, Strain WS" /LENGTH=313 /DNA_ID=CAMNT_0005233751 /DNA_START=32 /DNA_END=973 /DNA_ORIENTATION=+